MRAHAIDRLSQSSVQLYARGKFAPVCVPLYITRRQIVRAPVAHRGRKHRLMRSECERLSRGARSY
jgi:hypothetical protein